MAVLLEIAASVAIDHLDYRAIARIGRRAQFSGRSVPRIARLRQQEWGFPVVIGRSV
jgi:hypothetical protein